MTTATPTVLIIDHTPDAYNRPRTRWFANRNQVRQPVSEGEFYGWLGMKEYDGHAAGASVVYALKENK